MLVEMAVGDPGEEIDQVAIGLDPVHLATADQAGKARPRPAARVVACEECVAAVHGWAADGVLDQVGVDVAVLQKQPEAFRAAEHLGHGLAEIGLARDPGGLGGKPA